MPVYTAGFLSAVWLSLQTCDILTPLPARADLYAAMRMLGGERITDNTLSFQNDMRNFKIKDDVLTLLIHLGYLAYDAQAREAFIPNKEIIGEFENAMSIGGWQLCGLFGLSLS